MTNCYICKSSDLIKGVVAPGGTSSTAPRVFFKPVDLKFLTMTIQAGVPIDAYVCQSCGLIWTHTDPAALREFMQKYCDKE